jgi:hypothetical protein
LQQNDFSGSFIFRPEPWALRPLPLAQPWRRLLEVSQFLGCAHNCNILQMHKTCLVLSATLIRSPKWDFFPDILDSRPECSAIQLGLGLVCSHTTKKKLVFQNLCPKTQRRLSFPSTRRAIKSDGTDPMRVARIERGPLLCTQAAAEPYNFSCQYAKSIAHFACRLVAKDPKNGNTFSTSPPTHHLRSPARRFVATTPRRFYHDIQQCIPSFERFSPETELSLGLSCAIIF